MLFSTLYVNAQTTTLYSNDFSTNVGLSVIDYDGDTNNWGLYTGDVATASWGITGNFAGSESYDGESGVGLTPDNFLITSGFTIPVAAGATTTISFKIGSPDDTYFAEKISVYVYPSTINTAAGIIATTPVFVRTLKADNVKTALTYSIDLVGLQGQSVNIALRHHDCIDENILYLDDLLVTQTAALSTKDLSKVNFNIFPNPVEDVLNISKSSESEIISVDITDLNGRTIKSVNNDFSTINVSDLSTGIYFINVRSEEGFATKKLIKK